MVYQMREAVIGYPGNQLLDRVTMEIKNTEKIAVPYDYKTFQEKKQNGLKNCDVSLVNVYGNTRLEEKQAKDQIENGNKRLSGYSGNERARKERRSSHLEAQIIKKEEKVKEMKEQYSIPHIATNYEKLSELEEEIRKEEQMLNELLFEWSNLVL